MADLAAPKAQIFRFGPFELDIRAGELRKHGIRLRLREQPFQILLMLLEHPGEVVLREEIRQKLWPNNTIVEFDHSINTAIKRVRDALGETADDPRYIETVASRGYRFLGAVETVGGAAPNLVQEPKPPADPAEFEALDTGDLTGKTVAHYRILDKLGEGGMGVVYRAEDLKLGRQVALKFLPGSEAELPASAVQRFDREARAIASLNHPHICQIYEVGPNYLAMELIEGQPLKGPMSREDAMRLAGQIADALDAAHGKGITHRDLKPTNILVSKNGVKLLDFGLAKVRQTVRANGENLNGELSGAGTILGTLHYMSPEQIEGKEADARSDIFSFGLVLYEMITGKRPFEASSHTSVIAAILEREPPAIEPESLDRVLKACLAKDPNDRFQTARDLKRAIEWSVSGSGLAVVPRTSRKWIPWAAAATFAALALLVWLRAGPVAAPPRLALTIVPPSRLSPVGTNRSAPEISPDGSSLLYYSAGGLWVRRLDSLEPKLLRGVQALSNPPFWSADSQTVAFPARTDLMTIRASDGVPEVIAKLPGPTRGGTWSDDNQILFSSESGLYAMPASRREARLVDMTQMKAGRYEYPQFLAGSDDFLFLLMPEDAEGGEVYLATLRDGKAINPILLMKNDTAVRYTPAGGGRILFVRNDNLFSQRLDRRGRKLEGDAELLQQGVASGPGSQINRADFSVSRSGVVAWRPGKAALSQVTMFDRRGNEIGTAGPPLPINSVALSPDETRLVASGDNSWMLSPGQGGSLSLGKGRWSLWSPDGLRLLGGWVGSGRIAERLVNGSNEVHDLGDSNSLPQDVSPDGKQVLTMMITDGIYSSRLEGTSQERAPRAIVHNGEMAGVPGFSPDGRWVVYSVMGMANGPSGVYVQPFPGPALRTQIATDGFPIWRKDGKEIAMVKGSAVWSVHVEAAGGGLRFGTPELLFSGLRMPTGWNFTSRPLAVSRDGSRFYFSQAVDQPDSNVIHVRTGW